MVTRPSRILTDNGASPPSVVTYEALPEGKAIGRMVNAAKDTCVVALARGSSTVQDLDIVVLDENGSLVARDTRVSRTPTLFLCPPHPTRMYVQASVSSGFGMTVLTVQSIPSDKALKASMDVHGVLIGDISVEPSQGLSEQLGRTFRQHQHDLGGSWTNVRRSRLRLSPRWTSYSSVTVPKNKCLDIYVSTDERVGGLNVEITDEQGRLLTVAKPRGEDRTALLCGRAGQRITVAVRPRHGAGLASVLFSFSDALLDAQLARLPDAVFWDPVVALDKAEPQLDSQLRSRGYRPKSARIEGELKPEATHEHSIDLTSGCWRLDTLVGPPARGAELRWWSSQDTLLARGTAGASGVLFACSDRAQQTSLSLTARGEAGPFTSSLRRCLVQFPSLNRYPQAASKLLHVLNDLRKRPPLNRGTTAPPSFSELELSDNKRIVMNLPAQPNRCVEYVVASNGTVHGLALKLHDAHGTWLGGSRGAEAAHVSLCRQSKIPVRLTIEADSGSGHVLLGAFFARPSAHTH